MDVDRALWWSVSWGWILLWVATLIALVVVVVLGWRWLRRREPEPEVPGLLFYVHGQRMINLCKVGRYDDAVTRQFVKQITVTKNGKLQVGPSEFGIGVDGSVVSQNTDTYEKPATEIDVIGVVLAGLRAGHGVVDVDLTTRTITADESWRRGKARRLNDIRDYVSLHGRFEVGDGDDAGGADRARGRASGAGGVRPGEPARHAAAGPVQRAVPRQGPVVERGDRRDRGAAGRRIPVDRRGTISA